MVKDCIKEQIRKTGNVNTSLQISSFNSGKNLGTECIKEKIKKTSDNAQVTKYIYSFASGKRRGKALC